ncbi:methyltransferase [Candidatus Pacearchaeota archaeon]|nr:methyltransferase [Candidatus Pacearchaeota archaeon]
MIYEPSEDSWLLEKEVRKYAKGKKVLDMGSGSGIQAASAKESWAKSVIAADIDKDTLSYLKKKGINAIHSNLFSKIKDKFDLIIFNPPYLPRDKREDKESSKITSGGKEGDEVIVKFLNQAKSHLNKNGIILMVLSSLTPQKRIEQVMKKLSFKKEIVAEKKIFMETLYVWKITLKASI